MRSYYYDLETYPNIFLFAGKFEDDDKVYVFEMSDRKNQKSELQSHLSYLRNCGDVVMMGYNNLGFDYPIIHDLVNNPWTFTYQTAAQLCQQIIGSQQYGFTQIKLQERAIPQCDLMKINHFDNKNKRTSLKALQCAMRSESVEDLPFDIRPLNDFEKDELIKYNIHDLTETEKFGKICKKHIMVRKELLDTGVLTGDVLNFSDVKLGTEYFIKKLGRMKCFSGHSPRQTLRDSVLFKDIILPKIQYRTEAFQQVHEWFLKQTVYTHKEAENPKLETKLAGLKFDFGVGGVHASVESKKYVSNANYVIKDVDVSGMYPAIAIANKFFPEHLGQEFVIAYRELQTERSKYKKGSTMNLILKLASNGVFGNSDNEYSCFYDPKYPKQVTVNGQLQLIQLTELLSLIPGLEIIQANTDGVTALVPRKNEHLFKIWCDHWEVDTGLKLEYADYEKMFIRDVNNYIAVTKDGKVKSKGAYWYPKTDEDYWGSSGSNWNKDFSMLVVPKVTEQVLINDWYPEALLKSMTDPFDFMIRYKTPAGAKIYIGDQPMSKTVRYYVSKTGQPMKKVSVPKGEIGAYKRKNSLTDAYFNEIMAQIPKGAWDARIHTAKKSVYEQVVTSIESGWLVKECNKASDFNWDDLNYDYYLNEINKLLIGE